MLSPTTGPAAKPAQVFYVPGEFSALDEVCTRPDGTVIGAWSGMTQAEFEERHAGCIVVNRDDVIAMIREAACTAPRAITARDFYAALGCMPPVAWTKRSSTETFFLCERFTVDVAQAYVRVEQQYFTFRRPQSTSHEGLVAAAKAHQDNLDSC